ncbi:MAG: class B sortase, partial [Bacilli bacterium]|nr:class B sortase [Bacilli bacterium]
IKEEIKKEITIKDNSYKVDFKSLKEKNSDTVAYIKVNNTNIDYVVVQTNNNDYYLKHNFNKEYNVAGWVFMDYRNKLDGTDKNIIIYGHNTKDNSMFDSLKNVLTKEWQTNKDNLFITLITESNEYKYQVFSTYEIKPEDFYITTNFKSTDNYVYFLNKISSRSNYNYKVELNEFDRILTLSSCLGEGQTRVVLHARLM